MITSSGLASRLSTISLAVGALALAGCPDTQGRFDDFNERVIDANAGGGPDAALFTDLPDVSGTFLLGLEIVFVPGRPVHLIATTTLTPKVGGAELDLTLQFLTIETRLPTGSPITVNDVPVDQTGAFMISRMATVIPKAANPLDRDATADILLTGSIKTADLFCGPAGGMVTEPTEVSLNGSTFAAIRVQAGQTGTDLPATVARCP